MPARARTAVRPSAPFTRRLLLSSLRRRARRAPTDQSFPVVCTRRALHQLCRQAKVRRPRSACGPTLAHPAPAAGHGWIAYRAHRARRANHPSAELPSASPSPSWVRQESGSSRASTSAARCPGVPPTRSPASSRSRDGCLSSRPATCPSCPSTRSRRPRPPSPRTTSSRASTTRCSGPPSRGARAPPPPPPLPTRCWSRMPLAMLPGLVPPPRPPPRRRGQSAAPT